MLVNLIRFNRSLVQLKREINEESELPYWGQWLKSGEIKKRIKNVEKRIKHCQDLFIVSVGLYFNEFKVIECIADRYTVVDCSYGVAYG